MVLKTFNTTAHRGAAALMVCTLAGIGCQAKLDCKAKGHTDIVVLQDWHNAAGVLLLHAGERFRYQPA